MQLEDYLRTLPITKFSLGTALEGRDMRGIRRLQKREPTLCCGEDRAGRRSVRIYTWQMGWCWAAPGTARRSGEYPEGNSAGSQWMSRDWAKGGY